MTDITVAMPWRPTPDRVRAYERVSRFWLEEMGLELITADSGAGAFNRSEARNNAVEAVTTEIVIVADADVMPQPMALAMALMDGIGGEVCWLYDEYRIIDPFWIDAPNPWMGQRMRCFCGQMLPGCCGAVSGLFICRTETYWRLGGHDVRFGAQWGGEDNAFACAAATLAGARRVPGLAVSFDHDAERNVRNISHWLAVYDTAMGDPHAMEELLMDPARGHVALGVEEWKQRWISPSPGVRWPPRPKGVEWLD
jgi:hypothetical protein